MSSERWFSSCCTYVVVSGRTSRQILSHTPEMCMIYMWVRCSLCRRECMTLKMYRFYPRDVVSAVYATATWMGGWVSVTRRYCIKMAKPILKLFRPSGSPSILVSSDPVPIPNSKGNPFSGGVKYTGVGKIGDFRRKSPCFSEAAQ